MLHIDRILWPTDRSDEAGRALPYAAALADWHDAELHVLHVATGEAPEPAFPIPDATLADHMRAADPPGGAPDIGGLTIRQAQREDRPPAEEILAYADEQGIDLVVMSTHGERGLRRLLIGSVTEEVVRRASCPVLTVRADATRAWNVRTVLAPIDFSDASQDAVRHARELALTYGAKMTLLHAVEEAAYPSAYGIEAAPLPGDDVVGRVEQSLAEMAESEIGYEHVTVEATLGYAPSAILNHAETEDVDLIVIATHGRTGLDRMLLGSVAERVVRRAPCPVFVVKSFGKSLLPDTAPAA